MRLYLVRHGETVDNKNGILQGQTHSKLSDRGHKEAVLVGKRLKQRRFDAIYSSDLVRCKETVAYIRRHHKNRVRYTKLLRELHAGIFQGRPGSMLRLHREQSGLTLEEYRPPGGETYMDLRKRVVRFLAMLAHHNDRTVLAVTHGGFIRMCLSVALGIPPAEAMRKPIANTGITIIKLGKKPKLLTLNESRHLKKRTFKRAST